MYDSLIEENQELRDSNKYLREKLREAYKEQAKFDKEQAKFDKGRKESAYLNLLTTYQKLLVKNVTQQHQIDQLEGTVHRLTVKDRLKMVK